LTAVENCSFEIAGQTGWDVWVAVCALASIVLLGQLLAYWIRGGRGLVQTMLCGMGVAGTAAILAVPGFHTPAVGMVWTFVLLCLLSGVFYLNLIGHLAAVQMGVLLALRIVALALLVLMLFDPTQRCYRAWKPERPLLFLVDTSGSMSFPDVQNGPSRIQSVWQALSSQLQKIDSHFVPSYYTFDSAFRQLKKAQDLATIKADGKSTDIVMGLTNTLAKATREDAVIVLLSDGNDNTSPDVAAAIQDAGHRVYTVSVGSDQTEQAAIANIAVRDIEAAEDFVVGHESQIKATIASSALANRVVDVKLAEVDSAGKPIGAPVAKSLVLQPVAAGQTVQLPYTPHSVGVHRIAVWVDPVPGEQNIADNRQEFQGLALDPRIKVLYIEGRLRPEYRDLNRSLQRDPNVEVATLLRLQKDRFAASGTVDGAPFTGIPTSGEQWAKFDVIILGDLDISFLPPAQQAAIEQRVQNGAGLLMIGGQNNFGPGGYSGSPIEKALPVFIGDHNAAQDKLEFVPKLTPLGMTHPALEGLGQWFGGATTQPSATTAPSLPPLRGNVVTGAAKDGAQVLLTHADRTAPGGGPEIVLAVERYGKGRSAAFTVDTTYLWNLPLYGLGQDSPYSKIWAQLIRWLAGTDVRNRQKGAGIEALLNKNLFQLGENVSVRALVRDEHGDATRYAQVQLKLKQPGKDEQTFALSPVESHNGMYSMVLPHPDKGDYVATLVATKDGKELGKQELKFSVLPPADELLKIAANPKLMQEIATATHGTTYELGALGALIDELIATDPHPRLPALQVIAFNNLVRALPAEFGLNFEWDSKYDLPMQGLLVVIVLTAEWMMRRWWQLP
jgi:uncharacterized membrane protein